MFVGGDIVCFFFLIFNKDMKGKVLRKKTRLPQTGRLLNPPLHILSANKK